MNNLHALLPIDQRIRARATLRAIVAATEEYQRPPSLRELADILDVTYEAVRKRLRRLQRLGLVTFTPRLHCTYRLTDKGRRMVQGGVC